MVRYMSLCGSQIRKSTKKTNEFGKDVFTLTNETDPILIYEEYGYVRSYDNRRL